VATRAPKLSRQEGHINWNVSAAALFNKIRAFKPFPGTYFFIDGKRINVEWGEPVGGGINTGTDIDTGINKNININPNPDKKIPGPGTVLTAKGDCIDVQCASGVLRVTKVKPEGRPSMDARAFLLGHSIPEGTVLE
jgi:methionyl-tRNA formyltransferase